MMNGKAHITEDTSLKGIFEENSAILDNLVAVLESMRKDRRDLPFSPEESKLLDAARQLLENNRKISKLLIKSRNQ